nr:MAG TPA: Methyltransferase domain [Caudoviricetes sp.]
MFRGEESLAVCFSGGCRTGWQGFEGFLWELLPSRGGVMKDIRILDACCGSRMFWFDKKEPHTTYMDRREEEFEIHKKKINVKPDIVADFRDMPFDDETFNLVVFDPPHLLWAGQKSFMRAQYGQLDLLTWRLDLQQGFEECFRVLKTGGTLIFKWSDAQVNVKEILELVPHQPLFGQQRGTTHWMAFMKF